MNAGSTLLHVGSGPRFVGLRHGEPGEVVDRWHHGRIRSATPDLTTLIELVQRGDQAAFAEIYDAVAPMVFSTVSRVLRDPAMSEEVTQEVFVEVWTHAARFDPEKASVSTWAVTIARRRAIDRVRKEQSQRDRVEQLAQRRPEVASLTDDAAVSRIEGPRVDRALADLPPDQREIIELAFIEGLSHSTIAERLGLPLGTVKGRVRGGLQRLSSALGGAT
jgi:RNA polymerase sigma-70 factor, ECF subfamily